MSLRASQPLSERERACIAIITAGAATLSDIAHGLGLKQRCQADRVVLRLKRRGLVTRAGGELQITHDQSSQISTQP